MEPSPRIAFARRIAAHDPTLRVYAILDADTCVRRNLPLLETVQAWREAGIQIIQYRDKAAGPDTLRRNARALRDIFPQGEAFLILNDHPDLISECDFDGAHIGQTDITASEARRHLGPDRILGVSTHSADQALAANSTEADYVAVGPVFATSTKANAEQVVGLCGVQAARAVTTKPLVAIGGIGLGDARSVQTAGADSVAVVSALLPSSNLAEVKARAQDFLARLK
ncbi:thiamine phosphate synthase [Terriglobus sp.]|uniref:thiamine phosphate synthase n=1 Tax=Terriglobus sp. TaxID=1889013 RepID=UPI003AFFC71D